MIRSVLSGRVRGVREVSGPSSHMGPGEENAEQRNICAKSQDVIIVVQLSYSDVISMILRPDISHRTNTAPFYNTLSCAITSSADLPLTYLDPNLYLLDMFQERRNTSSRAAWYIWAVPRAV